MIEPKMDFVEKVCNETWTLEDGKITVQPLAEDQEAMGGTWEVLDDFGMIWNGLWMIFGWFWMILVEFGWFQCLELS